VPEGQWEAFLAALRRPLPTTFRINGSGGYANELREKLESDFFSHFSSEPMEVCQRARACMCDRARWGCDGRTAGAC
jgi:16S rRNA C967 or C1407 C5-methylase (RsmB/RsmF family)